MADLGRLEPLDPRQVWAHEGHDFTPWLLTCVRRASFPVGADRSAQAPGLLARLV